MEARNIGKTRFPSIAVLKSLDWGCLIITNKGEVNEKNNLPQSGALD